MSLEKFSCQVRHTGAELNKTESCVIHRTEFPRILSPAPYLHLKGNTKLVLKDESGQEKKVQTSIMKSHKIKSNGTTSTKVKGLRCKRNIARETKSTDFPKNENMFLARTQTQNFEHLLTIKGCMRKCCLGSSKNP